MVTDLSGVLEERTVVRVVDKKGKTIRTEERPLFSVDERGSISVESMRGTKYYAYAQECDSENKNGWLQCGEIRKFLRKFKDKDVTTETYDLVYYQEKNDQGVVTKICTLNSNDKAGFVDEQLVFNFDNQGNVQRQIMYQVPGMKYAGTYIYDGVTDYFTKCNEQGDTLVHRHLDDDNYYYMNKTSNWVKNQKETESSKFIKKISSIFK